MKVDGPLAIPTDESRRYMLSEEYQALVRAGERLAPKHICNPLCEQARRRAAGEERN